MRRVGSLGVRELGGAVGRGALGEGGRRTENASFSVGVEWVRECVVLRQVRPASVDTRAAQQPAPSSPDGSSVAPGFRDGAERPLPLRSER
jgi:hypothetical protein